MTTLTQAEAKCLFEYRDGRLFWKIRPANRIKIGDKAGGTNGKKEPYLRLRIKEKRYLVHKIIFLIHYGYMPEIVDHIDGDISNNAIENLREATKEQNRQNSRTNKNNTSGSKNVFWQKSNKHWLVRLRCNGRKIDCGTFKEFELADLVAHEARSLYHKNFARHI